MNVIDFLCRMPYMIALAIGIVVSISQCRKHRLPASLAACGFGIALLLSISAPFVHNALLGMFDDRMFGARSASFVLNSLSVIYIGLFLGAIFTSRNKKECISVVDSDQLGSRTMSDQQDDSDENASKLPPSLLKASPRLLAFSTAGAAIGAFVMLAGNTAYGFPPVPGGALGGMLGGGIGGAIGHLIGKAILGSDATVAPERDATQLPGKTVDFPYAKRILIGFIIFWLVVFFVIIPIAILIDNL